MKKVIFAAATALMLCSCMNEIENDIKLLDKRIAALEERSSYMNETIKGLGAIVQSFDNYDFISDVKPVYNTKGQVVAYRLIFTNSGEVVIHNGENADTPIIGVEKDRNGQYYWTVTYSDGVANPIYLSNTGQLVYASALTPEIKIEDGNWMISYDKGASWNYLGKATGAAGNAFVQSLDTYPGFVRFNFIDGTSVNVPTYSMFQSSKAGLENLNSNLESLKALITSVEGKASVTDMIPIMNGADTIGCKITLKGENLAYNELSFFCATTTSLPEIKAVKEADGNYYWAIQYPGEASYQWILCGEDKVRMNVIQGTSPKIGLERDEYDNLYYWTISYDGGETFDWLLDNSGDKVAATASEVSNPITSLIETSPLFYTMTVVASVMFAVYYIYTILLYKK